jgi:hypothetical protein
MRSGQSDLDVRQVLWPPERGSQEAAIGKSKPGTAYFHDQVLRIKN